VQPATWTAARELHRDARADRWRMNLTAASSFPGLDGFARSLLAFVDAERAGEGDGPHQT
jgi:hypothetical protein